MKIIAINFKLYKIINESNIQVKCKILIFAKYKSYNLSKYN